MPEETTGSGKRGRRGIQALAAFALAIITSTAVGALAYMGIVNGDNQSVTQLATFGTLGLGALVALAGARSKDDGDGSNS